MNFANVICNIIIILLWVCSMLIFVFMSAIANNTIERLAKDNKDLQDKLNACQKVSLLAEVNKIETIEAIHSMYAQCQE